MLTLIPYTKKLYVSGQMKTVHYLILDRANRAKLSEVCEIIAERTTLSEYEVEFVLSELHKVVIENVEMGRGTELGRLGVVDPSLSTKSVENFDDLSLKTVKGMRLVFKPSVAIKKALKSLKYRMRKDMKAN